MEKKEILRGFGIESDSLCITPTGNGHINDTFKVSAPDLPGPGYILQRINNNVFTDVDTLQRNIETVTDHLRRKLELAGEHDIDRKVIRLLSNQQTGKTYLFDGENYWRAELLIDDAETREAVTPENARHAGEAFGRFQEMLSDLHGAAPAPAARGCGSRQNGKTGIGGMAHRGA